MAVGLHWRAPLRPRVQSQSWEAEVWRGRGSGRGAVDCGCSYLLHHPISGEFVVAGDGCGNREVRENELVNAFKVAPGGEVVTVSVHGSGSEVNFLALISALIFDSFVLFFFVASSQFGLWLCLCCILTQLPNSRA